MTSKMVEVILYSTVLLFMSIACSIKLRIASGAILIILFLFEKVYSKTVMIPLKTLYKLSTQKMVETFEIKIKPT